MADAMPFQQHWEYRTTHRLAAVINDKFFLPLAGNLRVGDEITMVSYDRPPTSHHDGRVVEIATVRIVAKEADSIEVFSVGEIISVPRKAEKVATGTLDHTDQFVPGDARVVWNVGKRAFDIKIGDSVLATEPDKEKAEAIARGDLPLTRHPREKAA